MRAEADGRRLRALGLGPLAVIPGCQGEGVGSTLMKAAVAEARASGVEIIFLLGDPEYYGRFGFTVGAAAAFESPYAGPYFQALALVDLPPLSSGIADYAAAFAELG
jgi:putative acetyltransferase